MAEFEPAFQKLMKNEGGFRLHTVKGDRGGMTYAGIARKSWQNWPGWVVIDRGDMQNSTLTQLVREFYLEKFWEPVSGSEIRDQSVANTLFGFAVNAGIRTAVRIAQSIVGALPDGALGPKTLAAINDADPNLFVSRYALGRISRYAAICNHNRSQDKFLLGWINRTLRTL